MTSFLKNLDYAILVAAITCKYVCVHVCVFGIAAIVNSEVKFVKLYSPELFAKISFNHTTELCLLCKEFFVFSKKRQRFLLAPHI